MPDECQGGDPPCWAHLFEEGDDALPEIRTSVQTSMVTPVGNPEPDVPPASHHSQTQVSPDVEPPDKAPASDH